MCIRDSIYTSGTTGKPKGAVHFHHDFPCSTECYAKKVLGLPEDDVFLSVSRLFFGCLSLIHI